MSEFRFTASASYLEELDHKIERLYEKKETLMHQGVGEWNPQLRAPISQKEDIATFELIALLLTRLENTLPVGSKEKQRIYHALNACRAFSETAAEFLKRGDNPFPLMGYMKKAE